MRHCGFRSASASQEAASSAIAEPHTSKDRSARYLAGRRLIYRCSARYAIAEPTCSGALIAEAACRAIAEPRCASYLQVRMDTYSRAASTSRRLLQSYTQRRASHQGGCCRAIAEPLHIKEAVRLPKGCYRYQN